VTPAHDLTKCRVFAAAAGVLAGGGAGGFRWVWGFATLIYLSSAFVWSSFIAGRELNLHGK